MADWDPLVNEIFLRAVEAGSPAERATIVDRACGDDAELWRKVQALLMAHEQAGTFLDHPAPGLAEVRPGESGAASTLPGKEAVDSATATGDGPATAARPAEPTQEFVADAPRARRTGPPPTRRGAGLPDRAVQAAPADRRRRHGRCLHGRAGDARPTQGGAQDHQTRDGHRPGRRPLRGRTPGPGPDGPSQHRQGLRRRRHRHRPALLRDGAGQGRPDHRVLRRSPSHAPRAAGVVRARLPGDPARPSEGDHPPRCQAVERAGHARQRPADAQGDRLRHRQSDRPATHRAVAVHAVRRHRRDAGVHEPRAGRAERAGRQHTQRRLLARRAAL